MLVSARVLVGRKYIFTSTNRATLQKQWAIFPSCYPIQTVVKDISFYEQNNSKFADLSTIFPIGSQCFMLGHPHYGAIGEVLYVY